MNEYTESGHLDHLANNLTTSTAGKQGENESTILQKCFLPNHKYRWEWDFYCQLDHNYIDLKF